MNLTLHDLDADIARRLAENPRFARLYAATGEKAPKSGGAASEPASNKVMRVFQSIGLMLFLQVLAGGTLNYLDPGGHNDSIGFVCGMMMFFGAPLCAAWLYWRGTVASAEVTAVVPEAIVTVRPDAPLALADLRDASRFLFGLPPAEQRYVDVVIALWDAAENETLAETEARDLLRQMNDLCASDRDLDAQETRLARLGGDTETARLTSERDALALRAGQASDPEARDALAQSLALCETRLAQAREVMPLRERVSAQREMLTQTLAALHEAVLRLGVAPAATFALADEINAAREAASRIAGQSRAVEAAVQELMAVGAG